MWTVEVVSHESIKPSSPTPPHHSTHRLSWLDRMSPPDPFTFIFFYSDVVDKTLPVLKSSLSRTLTLFYPLAGRLSPKDDSVVDCNDQGVDLFEARASSDAPLSQLLHRLADRDQLIQLQAPPRSTGSSSSSPLPLLSIQVTTFVACGSIAIAVSFSHVLVDAHSAAEFIVAWSNVASRDGHTSCADDSQVVRPVFDVASRFGLPSADCSALQDSARRLGATSGKEVAKRFVFEERAIDALRKPPADNPSAAPPPTRVVALAALLWRCCVRVRALRLQASADGNTRFAAVALIPVNMRGKASTLLPDHLFGNLCDTVAVAAPSETIGDRENVVRAKLSSEEKLRISIRRTDGEWVRRLQGEEKLSAVLKSFGEVKREARNYRGDGGDALIYSFSSWSRFPLYEADFGWGKPSLVAPGTMVLIGNGVVVMGRGAAGGMEAWVKLEEEEMLEFERDEELMSYASPLSSASV